MALKANFCALALAMAAAMLVNSAAAQRVCKGTEMFGRGRKAACAGAQLDEILLERVQPLVDVLDEMHAMQLADVRSAIDESISSMEAALSGTSSAAKADVEIASLAVVEEVEETDVQELSLNEELSQEESRSEDGMQSLETGVADLSLAGSEIDERFASLEELLSNNFSQVQDNLIEMAERFDNESEVVQSGVNESVTSLQQRINEVDVLVDAFDDDVDAMFAYFKSEIMSVNESAFNDQMDLYVEKSVKFIEVASRLNQTALREHAFFSLATNGLEDMMDELMVTSCKERSLMDAVHRLEGARHYLYRPPYLHERVFGVWLLAKTCEQGGLTLRLKFNFSDDTPQAAIVEAYDTFYEPLLRAFHHVFLRGNACYFTSKGVTPDGAYEIFIDFKCLSPLPPLFTSPELGRDYVPIDSKLYAFLYLVYTASRAIGPADFESLEVVGVAEDAVNF